jgi:hypothetical protein
MMAEHAAGGVQQAGAGGSCFVGRIFDRGSVAGLLRALHWLAAASTGIVGLGRLPNGRSWLR